VALCHNEVHLTPRNTARQTCQTHELTVSPVPARLDESVDYFGNRVSFFTIHEPHRALSVAARSEVELLPAAYIAPDSTPPWEEVRDALGGASDRESWEALQFIFDSPLVAASAMLAEFAAASFARGRPWMEAVLDLTARIHREFAYDPTATSVSTPLATVMETRRGVCQDFAHLQVGCLRALGLPARYVSGYLQTTRPADQPQLVGADASHAWLSSWCPGLGWVDFDPTNNVVPCWDHITVAWGREYADVGPIKGVFVGGGQHEMTVSVDVRALEGPAV
jgi:transglutaminase-like putative cysteine protease